MSEVQSGRNEQRVLILGANSLAAEAIRDTLTEAEIPSTLCDGLEDLRGQVLAGAGVILAAEEALSPHESGPLVETLCEQPRWSDLPILLLAHAAAESEQAGWATTVLNNVILLDQPVHKAALLSAVRSALRARRHQYEMRDYLVERDRSEEALRQSETRFRAFFDQAAAGIGEAEPGNRRFTRVNDYFCRILGYTREEMLSMDISQITHPDDQALSREWFDRLMRGEANEYSIEKRYIRKDGRVIWVQLQVTAVRDEHERPRTSFGIVHDITQRKQAEEQLLALNATLEQRVAERTAEAQQRAAQLSALAAELTLTEQRERQRLAEILHDHLQQLLVGARFNISLLRTRTDIPDLKLSLQQVAELLDDSLRTSRSLTAELSPPVLYQGTLADVLRWLVNWMQEKHGLHVHLKADEQVNPPAEEIRLLLFQAARELLFNIVKHAGVGEACMELSRLDKERLSLTIADSGRGFDPSPRQAKAESGFGLFSIRERLNLLGGCMDIQSAVGQGTRATLIAPLQTRAVADLAVAPTVEPAQAKVCPLATAPAASQGARRIRVLLADDHRVMRDGLAQLLQTCDGIEVIAHASDGQETVDLARQVRPDVVVMDVSMPRLGGIEATRLLHAEMPGLCVIGLSMHTEPNVAEAMAAAGAAAYLAKSAPPESLVAAILEHHAAV